VVELPCSRLPSLQGAAEPAVVLATARNPERSGGLEVVQIGQRLAVKIGRTTLTRVDLASSQQPLDCTYRLRVADDGWSLAGGPNSAVVGGKLGERPSVSGLFSQVDLRRKARPAIEVTTATYATRPTTLQTIAWAAAVLGALSALVLVAVEARPGGRRPRA